jgi:hypothetical protein
LIAKIAIKLLFCITKKEKRQHAILSDYFFVLIFAMTVSEPQHAILSLLNDCLRIPKQRKKKLKLCFALLNLSFMEWRALYLLC